MIDVLTGRVIDRPQITITEGRISVVGVQDPRCRPERAAWIYRA